MDTENPKKGNRWMRVLLVVSLGVNLLVAGMVAGAYFGGGSEKRSGANGLRNSWVGPYGRALSKEDRAEMRKSFEGRKPWFDERRGRMRGFGNEMANAVRAEPFDPAVVNDILQRQRSLQSAIQAEGQSMLVDRLTAMTAEQRAAFAENLEKGLRRGKRRQ